MNESLFVLVPIGLLVINMLSLLSMIIYCRRPPPIAMAYPIPPLLAFAILAILIIIAKA